MLVLIMNHVVLMQSSVILDILVVDYAWKQVMIQVVHDHASLGCDDEVWLF